jgi:hypothetical protein
MKYTNKFLIAFASICIIIAGCKKDKNKEVITDAPNPPKITLSNEIIITTLGAEFFMEADLTDDVGLKSFTIRYDDWYLYNTVPLTDLGSPKSYRVKYKFRMPDTAANKIHSITLTATNVGNNATAKQYKVSLNTDFPKMYLTETTDPAKLTSDLLGVPMLINKLGSYSYETTYYSSAANSKIWFIPGKTAIRPIMYGVDPANTTKLTGDFTKAQPIVLPAVGYYKINIHTLNLTYTVTPLPAPNPANAFTQVAIAGRGFTDFPTMNYQNVLPNIILLDKDPTNPYLFTKLVKVGIPAGQTYTTAAFIFTTNNGWTNFWRFDNGADPEATVFNGGTDAVLNITASPIEYKVTFDTFTNRAKFEKQ